MKRKQGFLRKIFTIQFYWLFTILLLTVPFRIFFARQCDEVHITLAKETSTEVIVDTSDLSSNNSKQSWLRNWFNFNAPPAMQESQDELISDQSVPLNSSEIEIKETKNQTIETKDTKNQTTKSQQEHNPIYHSKESTETEVEEANEETFVSQKRNVTAGDEVNETNSVDNVKE